MSGGSGGIVIRGSPGEHRGCAPTERRLHVALVEHGLVDDECFYRACTPSKALLRPWEVVLGMNDAEATT
jgi:pyruvate/2-oxoglutarate dehydrogenase complex dihydrolipoamide dehydrogenase (E3) component